MRRVGCRAAVFSLALAATLALGIGAGATAAFAEDTGGVGITVTVSPSPVEPGGAVPVSGSGSGSPGQGQGSGSALGGSGSPAGGTGNTVVTGGARATAPVPADDEFDLGGVVFISGVTSGYGWSINPFAGETHAEFTVHNVSQFTIDGSAAFQLVGPFGNEITRVDGITLDQLKPDESRIVEATLTGLGQWTFFTIHATFTPPDSVGGTALTPITRDGFLFVLPWLLLGLLILAAGAHRVVTVIRNPPPTGAAAPATVGLAHESSTAGGVAA